MRDIFLHTQRGLHPDLAKRSIDPENPDKIDEFTRSSLLDVVPQYGGSNGDHRVLNIEWLDTQKNIASAKVISNNFVDYVHLCRTNDQWNHTYFPLRPAPFKSGWAVQRVPL